MPGARAKGLLAKKAMAKQPTAEEMQVAMNTPFHRGEPVLKLVSKLGFRAMMYAMVMKVVRPATTSVFTVVRLSDKRNNFSICSPFFFPQ